VYLESWKPAVEAKDPSIVLVPTEEELEEEVNVLLLSPEDAWAIFLQQKLPLLWNLLFPTR
jgi:hypothetical protein